MRNVKALNALLWAANAALGVAVVWFAFSYLLFPEEAGWLADFRLENTGTITGPRRQADSGDGALKALRNPVLPGQARGSGPESLGPTAFKAILLGTLPGKADGVGAAFIKSSQRNVELVAFLGEEIRLDGKPFDELRGWKLVGVTKDAAVFSDGARREELRLDRAAKPVAGGAPGPASASDGSKVGQPYVSDAYQSRLLASSQNRYVWGLDLDEVEWASQNADSIMEQDFQVAPFAGGGLKISTVRAGSIGASRGLMAGDIVKNVNGQALNSLADLKVLMGNPQMRRASGMSLTVERAGKPLVIEYRPLPKRR